MKTSESVVKLFSALLEAQKSFPAIPKNRTAKVKTKTGGEYSYNYADISDILHVIVPILNRQGIAFSQPHVLAGDRVRVTTQLMHSSGEWMQSDGLPLGEFVNPQELGASSTYMRRYEVCSMLGIVAEDDSDAQEIATLRQAAKPAFVQRPATPIRQQPVNEDAEPDGPMFDESGDMVEARSTVQHREAKQGPPDMVFTPASGKPVSIPQGKRFVATALSNGRDWKQIDAIFKQMRIEKSDQIPYNQYDAIIEWAGGKNEKRA